MLIDQYLLEILATCVQHRALLYSGLLVMAQQASQYVAKRVYGSIAVCVFSWQRYYQGQQQIVAMQRKESKKNEIIIWICIITRKYSSLESPHF